MNRRLATAVAAAVALAACNGRPSAAGLGVLPQSSASEQTIAPHPARGHSWMLAEAKSDVLVYVSVQQYNNSGLYVYSYPQGKQVGFLQPDTDQYEGLCADSHGNVWMLNWSTNGQAFYYEYPHGGSNPIHSIIAVGVPSGCSVDPSTGNLAIANYIDYGSRGHNGDLAVYQQATGKPTYYQDSSIKHYYFCAYDSKGNLYSDGDTNYINVLARNSQTLRHVYFDKKIAPGSMQWNSGTLVIALIGGAKEPVHVDRATIQGSSAHVTGTTSLQTNPGWGNYLNVQFWIAGKAIAGPGPGVGGPTRTLYFWPYPAGGKASKRIEAPNNGNFYGVAISP